MKLYSHVQKILISAILSACVVLSPFTVSAVLEDSNERFSVAAKDSATLHKTVGALVLDLSTIVEQSISAHIKHISEKNPQSTRIEQLNSNVNPQRVTIIENIRRLSTNPIAIEPATLNTLEYKIVEDLDILHKRLKDISNVDAPTRQYRTSITETISQAQPVVASQISSLTTSNNDLVFRDSDNDTMSDFDERFVFNTDPYTPTVVDVPVQYEDPRVLGAATTDAYSVSSIAFVSEQDTKQILFQGTALPNSTLILYVYSNPIIVKIKANAKGIWEYVMTDPLPDGDHTAFVASVNGEGNIVTKSEPAEFSKNPTSIVLDKIGLTHEVLEDRKERFQSNIIIIVIGVLCISIVFIGVLYRMITKT